MPKKAKNGKRKPTKKKTEQTSAPKSEEAVEVVDSPRTFDVRPSEPECAIISNMTVEAPSPEPISFGSLTVDDVTIELPEVKSPVTPATRSLLRKLVNESTSSLLL